MAKKTLTVGVNAILFDMINPAAKSLQVEQALMAFFNVDPVTLGPNVTEYAGGSKPLPTSGQHPVVRAMPPQSGKPSKRTACPLAADRYDKSLAAAERRGQEQYLKFQAEYYRLPE